MLEGTAASHKESVGEEKDAVDDSNHIVTGMLLLKLLLSFHTDVSFPSPCPAVVVYAALKFFDSLVSEDDIEETPLYCSRFMLNQSFMYYDQMIFLFLVLVLLTIYPRCPL